MPKAPAIKKPRVYEVAKDLGMSSEAVLRIVKRLGVEAKNHMSTLLPETVEKIRAEMAQETTAVKEGLARKHEHELQRARDERARLAAAAAAAAAQRPKATPAAPGSHGAAGPAPRGALGTAARPSLAAGPRPPLGRGPRRRDRKKKKSVDDKVVMESVRKTLASLDSGTRRRHRRREDGEGDVAVEESKTLRATEFMTVAELANLMEVKPQEVITACMRLGLMATINKRLDRDSIMTVADEFGFQVEFVAEYGAEEETDAEVATEEQLTPRAPVVTVMGHVDHGKTSLLDYIRKTNVIAGESGGITQHIGAYDVELAGGKKICFLDTPGHEAFTAMRARGAQATDLVVLVVAADGGVQPQTIEAIDHAKAASVPIVVAINKIDLPNAQPERIKSDLANHGVVIEEYGGKNVCVEISAKKGTHVDRLLEMILLVAELLDLKADASRRAKGVVLETRLERGRGVVASILVQGGTLRLGDAFVAGQQHGRVRAMFDERGHLVKDAGPSTPVEVLGWDGTPAAGDLFQAQDDEREAREIAAKRQAQHREQEFRAAKAISLTEIRTQITRGEVSELKIVLKGDVDGSVEALSESLGKLGSDEVQVRIIRQAVGQITESDVLLAAASGAIIVGFHVRPDARARELAGREKVEIRLYEIIYKVVEEVKAALEGMLKPEIREVVLGAAEVRQVFKLSKSGTVAGCMITSGNMPRTAKVRLLRDGTIVWNGRIGSLRRFKEDVREVATGFECGIALDGMNDLKVGDVIEAYTVEELPRTLS